MAKKKAGVSEVETQPEEVVITDGLEQEEPIIIDDDGQEEPETDENEQDDIEIPLTDEEPQPEEDEEPEPQPKDKFDGLPPEKLVKSYHNLEKVMGRQGQEMGELKKKLAELETKNEPQTPEEKIMAMSDAELDNFIGTFKADILKPNAAIEDDDYGQKVILYNDLKEERTLRKLSREQESKTAQVNNAQVIDKFKATWSKALDGEELNEIERFAKEKLSDKYGNITKDDLEVALHKLKPTLYTNAIRMATADKEKERIARAEATKQPRLSGAGSSENTTQTISIKKLKAMPDYERQAFLATLPLSTIKKLKTML